VKQTYEFNVKRQRRRLKILMGLSQSGLKESPCVDIGELNSLKSIFGCTWCKCPDEYSPFNDSFEIMISSFVPFNRTALIFSKLFFLRIFSCLPFFSRFPRQSKQMIDAPEVPE